MLLLVVTFQPQKSTDHLKGSLPAVGSKGKHHHNFYEHLVIEEYCMCKLYAGEQTFNLSHQ